MQYKYQYKTGTVRRLRWCYDYELAARNQKNDLLMLTSGLFPYLQHTGSLLLTEKSLVINGSDGVVKEDIPFSHIDTIYLGYDDLYPRRLSKNYGSIWSPLRLTLDNGARIYLIIFGYFGLLIKTRFWFDTLKALLA